MPVTCSDILKIALAIILPPLGVFLEVGCGATLLINILLTCLGYIPGQALSAPLVCAPEDEKSERHVSRVHSALLAPNSGANSYGWPSAHAHGVYDDTTT